MAAHRSRPPPPRYVFVHRVLRATFQLHELQGGTTSFGGLASPISPGLASGFEAFPAVYRAPGLFWHRLGYEFPSVTGLPSSLAASESFRVRFSRFTPDRTFGVPGGTTHLGTTFQRRGVIRPCLLEGGRDFQVYHGPFCGARGLSPLATSRSHPLFFSRFHLGAVQIPSGTSPFDVAPPTSSPSPSRVWVSSCCHCSQITIWRIGPSAKGVAPLPWMSLSGLRFPDSSINLSFPGSPGEAGFLQAVSPRHLHSPLARGLSLAAFPFPVYGPRSRFTVGWGDEVRFHPFADVPFWGFPHLPFS